MGHDLRRGITDPGTQRAMRSRRILVGSSWKSLGRTIAVTVRRASAIRAARSIRWRTWAGEEACAT